MRATKYIAATIAALMLVTVGAEAAVNVTFVHPERYRDDDFRGKAKRGSVIAELTRHFDKLDRRYLKAGQRLDIEVIDARLAGRYEPWQRTFRDVRILRDTTPPRFTMRYTLREGGKVLAAGEETVTDAAYLWNSAARHSSERFAHEKHMLRDWFRKRFVRLSPPGG